jgi:uncharacterized protein (TIGR00369 family)
MPSITEAEVEEILSSTPFCQAFGFRLVELGPGRATILVPFNEAFERPGPLVSGPVYMAAADCAMWIAIMTRLGRTDMALTVEMKTNFLRGAYGQEITCSAEVLRLGRRIIYGTAECRNPQGQLLTHHTLTYIRPEAD